MLKKVIVNAPQGTHAAECQFEIARIHEEEDQADQAIAAYRKSGGGDYPRSPLAAEAQGKIGKPTWRKSQKGAGISLTLRGREATEEAIGLFSGGTCD